jgi:hypothetical protein
MFSTASVLLRVTMVGFDITLVLACVLRAETMMLKSEEEKTAVARRLVEPVFVRPSRLLTAFEAVLESVLLRLVEVLPVVVGALVVTTL